MVLGLRTRNASAQTRTPQAREEKRLTQGDVRNSFVSRRTVELTGPPSSLSLQVLTSSSIKTLQLLTNLDCSGVTGLSVGFDCHQTFAAGDVVGNSKRDLGETEVWYDADVFGKYVENLVHAVDQSHDY